MMMRLTGLLNPRPKTSRTNTPTPHKMALHTTHAGGDLRLEEEQWDVISSDKVLIMKSSALLYLLAVIEAKPLISFKGLVLPIFLKGTCKIVCVCV